ncbi:DAK2 domain-containing protein [Streptomyces sp. NPDC053431]|uniref:DAK2 domain-containing protein n=1 Tax=Streptomyces sp. NPDC053431 TaxID=3365703 RepID=UPI0037D86FAD
MPRAPQTLDAEAVRSWCAGALAALGREREEIDAINVYPVADGDTGTNLYLTLEAAAHAVDEAFAERSEAAPDVAEAIRAMAHGALLGARGNSGTILSQLLRGTAAVLAEGRDGDHLARALASAAEAARQAVAHPVEGTLLTVADAAAGACAGGGELVTVATAAYEGARAALERTPGQLDVLRRAGVVDAGGRGLVAVLGALVEALTGEAPVRSAEPAHRPVLAAADCEGAAAGPAYEVIYLLEAEDGAVERLRARLDELGESLVVVGGDGLWNVHVHVDDAGAAVEAGVEAGRPYRIRVTHFEGRGEPAGRAVVAVLPGEGLAGLCAEAGATTLLARPGEPPSGAELAEAIRRAHAREVVLLPNDGDLRQVAAAAAEQARAEGIRVALIPTRAAVQGIAALAVHEPDRRFDEDVVAMTAAAGATRYAELAVAERQSFTSAGVCQAGDVLGLIEGDVAVIGQDLTTTARTVLDRMLSAGGELVTLIVAADTPDTLAATLESHVRATYLAVDTTTYHAGDGAPPLLIGVE